jgi:hypothetical protein
MNEAQLKSWNEHVDVAFAKHSNLDEILETDGYAAARAEADRRNVVWFASAGAKRRPK